MKSAKLIFLDVITSLSVISNGAGGPSPIGLYFDLRPNFPVLMTND